MKTNWKIAGMVAVALGLGFLGCRGVKEGRDVPQTVERVDLNRYLGKWYEIGSFPKSFQKGCVATTAEYSLRDDGDIRVVNTCRDETLDGELREAEGKAWVVDDSNAKLKVQFFWPFRGDYWILELGENYEYAVVGAPDRDSLWILSRTPQMEPEKSRDILERLAKRGWDVGRFVYTPQLPAG